MSATDLATILILIVLACPPMAFVVIWLLKTIHDYLPAEDDP